MVTCIWVLNLIMSIVCRRLESCFLKKRWYSTHAEYVNLLIDMYIRIHKMNISLKIDFRWNWLLLIDCFFMEIKLFLFFVMSNFIISITYRDFMFKWSNWHQSAPNIPTYWSESQISCCLSITWWFRRRVIRLCRVPINFHHMI